MAQESKIETKLVKEVKKAGEEVLTEMYDEDTFKAKKTL